MSDNSSTTPNESLTPGYGPQEPDAIIWLENAGFAGNIMGGIFYGIVLTLFFQCVAAILNPKNKQPAGPKQVMLTYVFFMFSMGTIFTALNLNLQQRSYIAFRNFPEGGPIGYSLSQYSTWRGLIPNAVYIITNWFADGLLMYRCYIIYNMQRWVIILPMIMFGGSISMGIITLYKSSRPGSNLWTGLTVNFGLPYFTISIGLNVFLTLLISFRLIQHSQKLSKATSASTNLYKNIVTMLVESCALYAVTSILFIGTYAAENYASDLFLPILSQVQIISPFLIILRVATQSSVTETTDIAGRSTLGGSNLSSIRAASNSTATTRGASNNGTQIAMASLEDDSFEYDSVQKTGGAYGV